MRRLLESKTGDARSTALSKLANYLEDDTVTDELRKAFPELALRQQPDADPDSAEIDMAEERRRFEREITVALRKMGSDVRGMFVLHDLTLRSAANMLPPGELDILLEDYRNSRDPFDLLTAFLLLKQAGREVEAMPLMHDIAGLSPDGGKAEAAMAALPSLLNAYGWHVHATRVTRRTASAAEPNVELAFKLHDPLAILAHNTGTPLDAGSNRIHAARLMASPDQFMQAVRIYHADTRHPGVVVDYRSELQASLWPDRIAVEPGGLLGMKSQPSGSLLADVAMLDGGQDELTSWLRATSPEWFSKELEISRQIAANAVDRGLSARLRDTVRTAAERSALNCLDVKLIEALAQQTPAELPAELVDQMATLVFHDWRGNSAWSERVITSRKAMGVHQEGSDRMAALAAACRALGMRELATSLGRWSVAVDLMETGSSRHLTAYLDHLPKKDRTKALRDLLPLMGLNEARVMTGEGLGPMLSAMLDLAMTDEAGAMVDRYLKRRLYTNTLRFSTNAYKAMIGGIEANPHAKDDAVAVALARLDRPEDYQRLLWRKNMELRPRRSHLNLSMNISPMPLMDNRGALPKPDQVDDIGRYLDIQLALGRRLQSKGVLSRESRVAQICMLGQWCHEHKLEDRAASLLERAEKTSLGMLSGRLWVADLQRLLGKETAAEQIELELLRHELLPFPRVPAALDVLARKAGRDVADSMAFRLAGYSNHPDVLPRAVRYARRQEMKPEYLELTARLRKVNTLFLPPGSPCPFDGYASVAEWSSAVSATAAKLPSTPKPRPLPELAYESHPAIARVIVKGNDPAMIYVPIIHDSQFSHLSSGSMAGVRLNMVHCEEIADHLYGRYGVRHVLLEGVSKTFVDQYNRIPLQRRSLAEDDGTGMIVHRTWSRLLAEKAWTLLPASDKAIVGPLTSLGYKYDAIIVDTMKEAKEKGWLRNRDVFDTNRLSLEAELRTIAEEYNAKRREVLEKDPGLKGEYAITVTQRNDAFLDRLLAPGEPGIAFFGAGHWQELERQLEERDVSYMVVVPRGVSWPRKRMDDASIYADMLKLGCSLRRCNVELGDGGSDVIMVPIE